MENFFLDLRFVLRQLRKSPGFAATAMLMLAFGIGATTAIFSIVDGVLLRPLPFPDPDRLVVLGDKIEGTDFGGDGPSSVTVPDIIAYSRDTKSFTALGGYIFSSYELSGAGEAAQLNAARMTAGVFSALGVAPELGRLRDRQATAFVLIGRLKPGRTPARAEASLEPIARRLEQIYDDPGKDRKEPRVILLPGGRIYPLRDEDLPRVVGLPVVLVGLVLLMACINVANMLVARGAARRREIAVRLSIGGSRARIVRQLLTESLLLAALGARLAWGLCDGTWFTSPRYAARCPAT